LTRLVIDASALLSGIVGTDPSPPARLVDALFDGNFEAVVCPKLLGEVRRGLSQPYFLSRIDPADDYLVALALSARARAIVTGDRDLLDHPGLNPPALTVRAACELLGL
jgi:predicted nucleic acid-binding protein